MTTTASGLWRDFQLRSSPAVIESDSEQPASRSGISTVFSGERIEAVSAMKWTPQKAITEASGGGRLAREAERVADEVGDVLDLGHLVVVGEDHRVALGGQGADLLARSLDLLRREVEHRDRLVDGRKLSHRVPRKGTTSYVRWPGAVAPEPVE